MESKKVFDIEDGTPNSEHHEEAPLLSASTPGPNSTDTNMRRATSTNNSGTSDGAAPRTCRICLEEETCKATNPLISPCKCSGSTKYVHRQCLLRWRAMKEGTQAHYRCEICHFTYKFRRLWWAQVIGHPATTFILFAMLLTASSWLLGYVPLTEPLLGVKPGSNVWLHWVNGLLLVGLLGCVIMLVSVCVFPGSADLGCCNSCYLYGDMCPYAVVGGEECAGLLVVVVVAMAVAGLVFITSSLYGMLYRMVRERLKWAEHMVENIGETGRGGGSAVAGAAKRRRPGGGTAAAGGPDSSSSSGASGSSGAGGSGSALTPPSVHKDDMV